jgi:hypothetical protein
VGKAKTLRWVVDRGMANPENLAIIRDAGHHWLVAPHQPERVCYLDLEQIEEQEGGRESSARLRRAIKVNKKCACGSGRQAAVTVLRGWHCAGVQVVRKRTVG